MYRSRFRTYPYDFPPHPKKKELLRRRDFRVVFYVVCFLCMQYTTQPSLAAASGPTNYKLAPNQKMGGQILGWMVILIERGGDSEGGREGGREGTFSFI
jgi:hypothetical protein